MDERYHSIIEILVEKLNYDLALLIVKELYFLENSIKCQKCNKKVLRKDIIDSEYLCSEECNFCGMCINPYIICKFC